MLGLGRDRSAAHLAAHLDEFLRGSLSSGSFAVTGPWGAGKTTLLRDALARVSAKANERISIVPFTPWIYADQAAIYNGFAVLLLQETLKRGRARRKVAAGLRVLSSPLQASPVDLSATADALADIVDVTYTPEQIQKALAHALRKQGRKVLVVLDDLDRLDPAELLTVFKLIRLIADVPGLGYLLAFDEDTLLHLLQQTPIANGSPERARRYLEKVIARRTEVPPMTVAQMLDLLQPVLEAMPTAGGDDGLGSFRLDALFESRLTTPRAVERFAQALRDVPAALTGEVDHWDLCSSVFLRIFFPEVWGVIVRSRRTMTADHRGFADFLGDDAKLRAIDVQQQLTTLYATQPDGADLKRLVDYLFPALTTLAKGRDPSPGDLRGRRIGHPDFVDRYFWLDLPPGTISEGAVRAQLQDLVAPADADAVIRSIAARPGTGMAVLERAMQDDIVDNATLMNVLDAAYRIGVSGDLDTGHELVLKAAGLARQLLLRSEPNEYEAMLARHGAVSDWPLLRYVLVQDRQLDELPSRMKIKPLLMKARIDLAAQLGDNLRRAPSPSTDQVTTRQDFVDLHRLGGPAAQIASERFTATRWRALDIASLALHAARDNAGYFVMLDIDYLAELVGPDLVARLRATDLPAYPAVLDEGTQFRLAGPQVPNDVAAQLASFVLTTGRSLG